MFLRILLLTLTGLSFGLFVSGGVFTVLIAVGMIPRFAGKTNTAKKIFLYEEMIVAGVLFGLIFSLFNQYLPIGGFMINQGNTVLKVWRILGLLIHSVWGFFTGIFVGCLAVSIAEMLGSIPIFARRVRYKKGIGIAVLCMALGKALGSLLYFYLGF